MPKPSAPHDLARQWAMAQEEVVSFEARLADIRAELEKARNLMEDRSKDLRALLGANVPQRFFDVGEGRIVRVSLASGVELVSLEKADA